MSFRGTACSSPAGARLCAAGVVLALALQLGGCGSDSSPDPRAQVASAMQTSMKGDLTSLWQASVALQAAAPLPVGRGWDAALDAAAIESMKMAWVQARTAYEHVEGATAPIFTDLDIAIDERYDGFLATLGVTGDPDPFDGVGVTGMHAIERILYADVIPANVVTFEQSLPGYAPAAFPATEAQAAEFKNALCAKLVADARSLLDQWTPQQIDVAGAFMGLEGLMNEQQEKVNKASSGEEESRYSQRTMADLRANLAGTTKIYELFSDWLTSRPATATVPETGAQVDAVIKAAFASLSDVYMTIPGDAIPAPPVTWSAEAPSGADLLTPFGRLYEAVHAEVDPTANGSVVFEMDRAALLLDIPVLSP